MKKIQTITMLILLATVITICACGFAPALAETVDKADEWTSIDVTVRNSIDDSTFELAGEYAINMTKGMFDIRIAQADISAKIHYFNMIGYEMVGYDGWSASADNVYITKSTKSLNNVELLVLYEAKTLVVTFVDGMTNNVITSYNVSLNSTVKPPVATDYTAQGYVFTGWSGGDYVDIQSNMTLYSTYAPARYITVKMPDGSKTTLTVAKGTTLADVTAPEYQGKKFKAWQSLQGEKLDGTYVIEEDMTVQASYGGIVVPQWARTLIIVLVCVIVAVIIIALTFKFIKKGR